MASESVYNSMSDSSGFTLVEMAIIVCIAAVLAAIGIPAFSVWIPDYRLRSRVNELYSDMHLARMMAIKGNGKYKIAFSTASDTSYKLINTGGETEKTVALLPSDSGDKISFGCGGATKSAAKSGGTPPDDGVSYTGNILTFNPRGTGSSGYVYLHNCRGTSYAVGTLSSGVIFLKKWDKASSSWK